MLNYFLTVVSQIFSMFLMVLVGYIMCKVNMISDKGKKDMTNLLLKVVTPMVVISAYQRPFDAVLFKQWCISFAAATLAYAISIALAEVFYRNKKNVPLAESKLAVVLPNCGFMAFPLLQALASDTGIFLGSPSVIILNIIQWTYGVKLLEPKQKIDFKKLVLNPGIIAVVCSVALFCSPWKLPAPVYTAVNSIGTLNTPLAMIILGAILAQTDITEAFKSFKYYKLAFFRLIAAPCILLLLFKILPIPQNVMLVTFICAVVPTATAVSMITQLFDKDSSFAANTIVLSTVLSLVTVPVLLTIGKIILGY